MTGQWPIVLLGPQNESISVRFEPHKTFKTYKKAQIIVFLVWLILNYIGLLFSTHALYR